MADTYLLFPKGYSGAQQYQQNGQQSNDDQQSQLFKALLSQSMQNGTPNSSMGAAGHMLAQYMMMKGLQPQQGMDVSGMPGMVPDQTQPVQLPMPGYTSPVG